MITQVGVLLTSSALLLLAVLLQGRQLKAALVNLARRNHKRLPA